MAELFEIIASSLNDDGRVRRVDCSWPKDFARPHFMPYLVGTRRKSLHPRMVLDVRMNGKQLSMVTIRQVFQFFFLYIAFIFIWALLLISDGVSVFDAFGISISTMGCIGPAFGITGATETYAGLSAFSKGILCVSMLLGRLEMLTFLVMLKKDFWTSKSAW